MTAQKTGNDRSLPMLGGISAKTFLRDYWQKKPLLIRGAFAPFEAPLTAKEVLQLARREEAESRLIARRGKSWELTHGPLATRDFSRARDAKWTVLVQDTQHFSREAHALLARFDFIPRARIDDLMVSYAVAGGGVGPHVDSYDVFLLQGRGQRRWRISAQRDLSLKPGLPLKILKRFQPEQEWVLDEGDMLYLPPGIAHDGVAESECLTWSIGFRAPSAQELSAAYLDHLRDELQIEGLYEDPGLKPAARAAEIDSAMQARLRAMLGKVVRQTGDTKRMHDFFGRYLTEPKAHVFFDPPEAPLSAAAFRTQALRRGVELDLMSRMLYLGDTVYVNGEPASASAPMKRLADARELSAKESAANPNELFDLYVQGYLHLK